MNPNTDVAIIGAGFGGLAAALRLKKENKYSFVIFERAAEVGGTWRDNVYPGCGCDIPSHLYSFADELNPNWSRAFSGQAEILAYLKHCVEKNNLRPLIRFNSEIVKAEFNEAMGYWLLTDQHGTTTSARVVVSAMGPLNRPNFPDFEGLALFKGKVFHSSEWDTTYDLRGKKVALIGTGASAIQIVPNIAHQVAQLTLFQRTPPWIAPRLDRSIGSRERWLYQHLPFLQRAVRNLIYWILELRGLGFLGNKTIAKIGTQQCLNNINDHIKDPILRQKVTPTYQFGCKRVLISDDYYPALNLPHVHLEQQAIDHITPNGVVTTDGTHYEADLLVMCTGFVASEIFLDNVIRGRQQRNLLDEWRIDGPEAHRGIVVSGFPNMFFLLGPNSGLGHNSVVHIIESQVNYVIDYLHQLDRLGPHDYLDVRPEVQAAHNTELQTKLHNSVWGSGCHSWYQTSKGKNTTIYPGLTVTYRNETKRINPEDFEVVHGAEMVVA